MSPSIYLPVLYRGEPTYGHPDVLTQRAQPVVPHIQLEQQSLGLPPHEFLHFLHPRRWMGEIDPQSPFLGVQSHHLHTQSGGEEGGQLKERSREIGPYLRLQITLTRAIKSTIPREMPNVRSTDSHSHEREDVSMQEYHQGSNRSISTGSFCVMKQPMK